jgi:UDP-glucose 4-epimerase
VSHRGKIVVTGGAGFIGSHLIDRLLAGGVQRVVAIDNLSRGRLQNLAQHHGDSRLEFVEADVRDAASTAELLVGADAVYHLAAQSTVVGGVRDPECMFGTNVVGTFNLLRAARRHEVNRVVFASSRKVYGEPIALPVAEESPLLPINSYGASKAAGEAYCRVFRREFGLRVGILRLSNIYGPRDVGRVIPTWIQQSLRCEKLQVFGGKQVVDFLWIDDAIDALERAGLPDGPLQPINVGSGTGTRIVHLARRIGHLTSGYTRIDLQPARRMEVTRYVANVERMRQFLQIEPPLDPLARLASLINVPAKVLG